MKIKAIFILFLIPFLTFAQIDYNQYFKNTSMRFDFLLAGNHNEAEVFPVQIKQEPFWAGNKKNTIDPLDYGTYRFRIFDKETEKLIFSKGFCTLFQEWQTTSEAKTVGKTFYQAAIFPFPKKEINLSIEARNRDGIFEIIYHTEINPSNYFILEEQPEPFEIRTILENGKPEKHVDLVILSEGYTKPEMNRFFDDAKRVSNYLFEEEPFKSEKNKFNIKAVFASSAESGTDIPGEKVYKNTRFNSSFYTFDLPRYLSTTDMQTVYDVAASVPYDQVYLLVNSEKYGGGGFYNFVSVCTASNELTKEVFIHEFGHGFAGLGDEYYNSAVAYNDFYNLEIEPWEPNLTTLVNFETKWAEQVDKTTPIPTPRNLKYETKVGVYEGGGYTSKGIYSPYIDCRMKSNEANGFCPVCSKAIKRVISIYTE